MGATTWAYPEKNINLKACLDMINLHRHAVAAAYQHYLDKVNQFVSTAPHIGPRWPQDGFFLPSSESFMQRFDTLSAELTLKSLIRLSQLKTAATPEA